VILFFIKSQFENENHNQQNYSRQPLKNQCTLLFLINEGICGASGWEVLFAAQYGLSFFLLV
ncbi:hypothetical protein ABEX68_18305, partial [Bacillus safensis]